MRDSFILGLTGGIGTGKTTVSGMFKELGAIIIDADEISRHALDIGADCYSTTVEAFGPSIVAEDGRIDRKRLARIVFNDAYQLERLNGIIHPYVRRTIHAETERIKSSGCYLIVWDIPLLLESGYDKETDAVLVVTCPTEIRLERLYARSGLNKEEALSRMRAQMTDEQRCARANYVIDNNGTIGDLRSKVQAVFEQLQSK